MDSDAVRLPLATDLKTSVADVTKDARLFNALIERRGELLRVKKRPGAVATGWDFTTPIQGALGFGGLLYLLYDDTFEIVDVDNPSVPIGGLVGGYYAMIANPPTAPGPGDPYWSASPPGATRYKSAAMWIFGDYPANLHPAGNSPWKKQIQGAIGASQAATAQSLFDAMVALGGGLFWGVNFSFPRTAPGPSYPSLSGTAYRQIPAGTVSVSAPALGCSATFYSEATVDWTAGYVPGDVPAATILGGASSQFGVVRSNSTASGVTIQSTGTVARILYSSLSVNSLLAAIRYIEVSGADQPEYNGVFEVALSNTPLDNLADLTGYIYYDMSGTPAATPATGTISVDHFF